MHPKSERRNAPTLLTPSWQAQSVICAGIGLQHVETHRWTGRHVVIHRTGRAAGGHPCHADRGVKSCVAVRKTRSTYIHIDIQHGNLGKYFWIELHCSLIVLLDILLTDVLCNSGLQVHVTLYLLCSTRLCFFYAQAPVERQRGLLLNS